MMELFKGLEDALNRYGHAVFTIAQELGIQNPDWILTPYLFVNYVYGRPLDRPLVGLATAFGGLDRIWVLPAMIDQQWALVPSWIQRLDVDSLRESCSKAFHPYIAAMQEEIRLEEIRRRRKGSDGE